MTSQDPVDYAVEAHALHKTYRRSRHPVEALKGIDLQVPRGSIFGLLGPNGAGKSTFINTLAGVVIKDSGQVRIWGFDQDVNPRMTRAMIGVVPQELNYDPYFTPYESLDTQAGLYGVPPAQRRTMEILETVGLADQAHAWARSLSGGMQRRLLVAKAMVHDPPVLVLDEPTAGVDVELRTHLWNHVRRIRAAGTTVILTTHYLEEAQEMCDRIAIIAHGEVVACDTTSALLHRIDSKTLVFVPTSPLTALPESLQNPPRGVTIARRDDGAISVTYSRHRTTAAELLNLLTAAGIEVRDISADEPDLKDVFLLLTENANQGTVASSAANGV